MAEPMIFHTLPGCSFCGQPAGWDAKTIYGPWAYLCPTHFDELAHPSAAYQTSLEVAP